MQYARADLPGRHDLLLTAPWPTACSTPAGHQSNNTSGSLGCKELCIHILFAMVKVLRVPPSNPIVWQLSLTGKYPS